jgi:hypothetical protein
MFLYFLQQNVFVFSAAKCFCIFNSKTFCIFCNLMFLYCVVLLWKKSKFLVSKLDKIKQHPISVCRSMQTKWATKASFLHEVNFLNCININI